MDLKFRQYYFQYYKNKGVITMIEKTFNAYHQIAANAAINYFNGLGETIINFRKMEMKIVPSVIDTNHNIIAMRDIVFSSPILEGEFNCQKEGEIAQALFNKACMPYHDYVEAIYKTVCEEVDGGFKYNPHKSRISNK